MSANSQMLKGLLEGCILIIISKEVTYGYAICEALADYGFEDVNAGTVYPILVRLEKKKLISSEKRESPLGPKRKYFHLTEEGEAQIKSFIGEWKGIKGKVDQIIEEGPYD